MHILIVDDELIIREVIIQLLELFCPSIHQISEASSVTTAVHAIRTKKPDVLLLDIELGDGSGFSVLDYFPTTQQNVIFITAFNEYAIQAFKVSAIDYLLKPIDPDELKAAIEKAQRNISEAKVTENLKTKLLQAGEQLFNQRTRISLKTLDCIHVVNIAEIIYCEANRSYTTFYLIKNKKIIVSKPLKDQESKLSEATFLRVHQSYLVNLNHIICYEKGNKNRLVCTDGHTIPVAIRKKEQLLNLLEELY